MRSLLAAALVLASSLSASLALADAVPPGKDASAQDASSPAPDAGQSGCASLEASAPCDGKSAGDPCTLAGGGSGTCAALRCVDDAGRTMLACVTTGASSPSGSSSSGGGCGIAPGPGSSCVAPLVLAGALLLVARRRRRIG